MGLQINMKKLPEKSKLLNHVHCTLLWTYVAYIYKLVVAYTLKSLKVMSDVIDHALEICKLLKYSPRRDANFHK